MLTKKIFSTILLLLSLFCVFGVNAQNIRVNSFNMVPDDMTARVTAPVVDQNGDKCALIKVRTVETGFIFEGDMLGITKISHEVGEYWVYVSPKAKKITLKHPKLGVLNNYVYPELIKEATVYAMKLTTGRITTIVEEDEMIQWIAISSTPSEADVYINNKYLGKTPLDTLMPIGKYNYRLEKPMYHNTAGVFNLSKDEKQLIVQNLQPNFGFAYISSSPENGAEILIDGKSTGLHTPAKTEQLKSGEYTITLRKDLYKSVNKKIQISDEQTNELNLELLPKFAELKLITNPQAEIFINEQKVGQGTYRGRKLEGFYTIEVRQDKYHSRKQQVNLLAGENKEIRLNPIPKYGSLSIKTEPIGANIKLNGIEKGTSPKSLQNLLVGEYQVELSKEGFGTVMKQITVKENKTTNFKKKLPEGRKITINSSPQGAELRIDGFFVGKTPYSGTLVFGIHQIELVKGKFKEEEQIQIARSEGTHFNFNLRNLQKQGLKIPMVAVKGGTFNMGDSNSFYNDQIPTHEVKLSDFYISKYEVTVKQFSEFIKATSYVTDAEKKGYSGSFRRKMTGVNWRCDENGNKYKSYGNKPVLHVSWEDAKAFCEWVGGKLPTEAEWEYAARGGIHQVPYKYSGSNVIDDVAWYKDNSPKGIHPVGQKKANVLGIYDMTGNADEWCLDWYDEKYYEESPKVNPQGPINAVGRSRRVFRGGSYLLWARDVLELKYRNFAGVSFCDYTIGFRLVFKAE